MALPIRGKDFRQPLQMRIRILKTIDRYFMSEFLLYFVFGAVLVIIFLSVNAFLFQMMEPIIDKQVPFQIYIRILFYQVPAFAVMAFPMATLFATLISINRMSKDSEIDVLRTSGVSVMRMMVPMLFMGLLVSASSLLMLQKLVPISNNRSATLMRKFFTSDVVKKPMSDVFFKGRGNRHFYIEYVDPASRTLRNLIMYETRPGAFPNIYTAPVGVWGTKDLDLKNVRLHNFDSDGQLLYDAFFGEYSISIERQMDEFFGVQKTSQEMTIQELQNEIRLVKTSGHDPRSLETDLHFKISIPIASFIFVLLGVPLSIRAGRSGMMMGVTVCVVLILVYWVGTIVATMLGHKGQLPPAVAVWSQNALFLVIGIILLIRTRK